MRKERELFQVHKIDARKLNEIIKSEIIDVTITSPPYFNLKDYGYKEQIGYGQLYDEYLNDLSTVFKNVFDCTKETGTLWVIIDSFRQDGEVVPLPFDFSNRIKDIGWKLKDVIVWAKDRTVPWTHKGQMRSLFEYILVFAKSDNYNFYIDEVREFEVLKKWWVKYPERYNPRGKTPSGLWEFDIPTQGSWGNGYIKHFCPLPEELIAQILKLTTKENDIVLDPFAGSGAVLAKADNMYRRYIGFELNKAYIKMFKKYNAKTSQGKKEAYIQQQQNLIPQNEFENLNLNLRALKYCKNFYLKLPEKFQKGITKIFVSRTSKVSNKKNIKSIVDYKIYISPKVEKEKLLTLIEEITSKPPLSKFGIEAVFELQESLDTFVKNFLGSTIYTYSSKVTHKYKRQIKDFELAKTEHSELILSKIKLDLNEKDYE